MRRVPWYLPDRLAYMAVTAAAAIVVIGLATVSLTSPSPAYADHNSAYVVCPDPILEGNRGQMGVRSSGYKIKKAYFFTDHQYHTADSSDYEEYHGVKIESDSSGGDKTLWAPIVTKEDSHPEHDETFAMGFWDGGVWHHCVVTIEDDDAPEIIGVEVSSQPVDGNAYRAGDSIDVAVDLDSKVKVEGTPLLALFIGDGDGSTWRGAKYHAGSGSRSLIFRYAVQTEDLDHDGMSVGSASVGDNGGPEDGFSGNIYALGTDVPIDYTHSGVRGDRRQKVDGRPYVQDIRVISSPPDGWYEYRANQIIEFALSFDTDVEVEGEVTVGFFLSGVFGETKQGTPREAHYLRGSGTDVLVFGYTVRPGDMDDMGIVLAPGSNSTGFGGDGAIKAKGTSVEQNRVYTGGIRFTEHKVDTAAPSVSSVSIISRPASDQAYRAGEIISVEVEFSENVTLTGDVQLDLDVGGGVRQAALRPSTLTYSRSLVFDYEVQEGDADTDGVGIGANSVKPDEGGIYDSAGNAADLSYDVVPAEASQQVDTST